MDKFLVYVCKLYIDHFDDYDGDEPQVVYRDIPTDFILEYNYRLKGPGNPNYGIVEKAWGPNAEPDYRLNYETQKAALPEDTDLEDIDVSAFLFNGLILPKLHGPLTELLGPNEVYDAFQKLPTGLNVYEVDKVEPADFPYLCQKLEALKDGSELILEDVDGDFMMPDTDYSGGQWRQLTADERRQWYNCMLWYPPFWEK